MSDRTEEYFKLCHTAADYRDKGGKALLLPIDNAILWAGDEIERLKAQLKPKPRKGRTTKKPTR